MNELIIRAAQESDALDLHTINRDELGYDIALEKMQQQLAKLMKNPQHVILVAEENGRVVGYVHAKLYETLYFEPLWNLMALAVAAHSQGRGLGRQLLTCLEARARKSDIAGIRVNSGIARSGAHAFYQKCGYELRPDQKRFLKLFE